MPIDPRKLDLSGTHEIVDAITPPGGVPLSIIHISDPHCTASAHTLGQISNGVLHRDFQNSGKKLDDLASYITENRQTLGTNTIIITGDLTDSGDDEDYNDANCGILKFINRMRGAGFAVFAVPGNHDYCKEGNQFLTGQFNEGEQGRRDRFIGLITPQYAAAPKYPHFEEIKRSDGSLGARLILLDSMQDELDGNTDNNRAQGTLGAAQLGALSARLADYQADRANTKVIVAMHHSPFYDSGDLALSDASDFKAIVAGKIDCLIYGHVTRDFRYQAPRYLSKDNYEPEDAAIVQGQQTLGIPLINVQNLEYMGSTLPISVLDVVNRTRSVYYLRPYVIGLHKVICDEPATSFGDDLHIYVDNNPVTPAILADIGTETVREDITDIPDTIFQTAENLVASPRDEINIDKGQTYNFAVEFGVAEQVALSFMEDGDAAGAVTIDAKSVSGHGEQILSFKIKDDGRYRLFYSVTPTNIEYSQGGNGASLIGAVLDLNGVWSDGSAHSIAISRIFNAISIDMSHFNRVPAYGTLLDEQNIAVTFPDGGAFTGRLIGTDTILWSNNSSWKKKPTLHVFDSSGVLENKLS